jgi:hypothetical protein
MAGTVTITEESDVEGFEKVVFEWTSSSGGAADATTTGLYTGPIVWAAFEHAGVTTLYDVVIEDVGSLDILNGNGANLNTTSTVYKTKEDKLGVVYYSALTLGITNAGNAKSGTLTLIIGR